MTPDCEAFLRAVLKRSWNDAFKAVNGIEMSELLPAIAALDVLDRDDLWGQRQGSSGAVNMPRFEYAWSIVKNKSLPASQPSEVTAEEANGAQKFTVKPSPLSFDKDITDTLPMPNPNAPRLGESDFRDAALSIGGCEISAVMAVAKVESGGTKGFAGDGRPTIRYELHKFHEQTGGVYGVLHDPYDLTHPHLSEPTSEEGNSFHTKHQSREWDLLCGAMILRDDRKQRRISEALSSASWGMFQVMGENSTDLGWNSVVQFAVDMFGSEKNHLNAFVAFIKKNHLVGPMISQDWVVVARGYNGAQYLKNNYDENIKYAYTSIRAKRVAQGLAP